MVIDTAFQTTLSQWLEQELPEESLFLLGVEVKGKKNEPLFVVTLDGDQGVSVEHCALLNRKLNAYLEEQLGEHANFSVEVGSPGATEPLLFARQYTKLKGKTLFVKTSDKEFLGELLSSSPEKITLRLKEEKKKNSPKPKTKGTSKGEKEANEVSKEQTERSKQKQSNTAQELEINLREIKEATVRITF